MHREAKTFHKKQPVWLSETVGHKITVRYFFDYKKFSDYRLMYLAKRTLPNIGSVFLRSHRDVPFDPSIKNCAVVNYDANKVITSVWFQE